MPKIAMCSSAMIMADWLDALKTAAQNDFDAFEITCVFPSADPLDIKPGALAEAKGILQQHPMEICVHAPFFEINIAAYCKAIRETSIRITKSAIDMCHALNGKTLIVHNGDYTYKISGATRHNHPALEMQWASNLAALQEINAYANDKGVTICLENIIINDTSIDRCYADLLDIREAVGDSLKFTLDMGHARLSEGADEGIHVLGDAIGHIHLSDNFGEIDDHLPLGDGNYDYSAYIDFLKNFNHVITLEVINVGTDPEPVLRCRRAFKELLG
ncbi:MAG: sugar phosphate isomerase/epimerase family protein [Thermodesulfobacteriota bacterium]